MTVYVTSDIHFNHKNILEYHPERKLTGVTTLEEMNERIIENWNSMIFPGDTVYILGDVSMGSPKKNIELIMRLKGKKHLIKGNHDTLLTHRKPMVQYSIADSLFDSIQDVLHINYQYDEATKVLIFMSHYPHAHWMWESTGTIHLHGHMHGHPAGIAGRIFDVGMDTNNLFPYRLDDIVEKMLKITPKQSHHPRKEVCVD